MKSCAFIKGVKSNACLIIHSGRLSVVIVYKKLKKELSESPLTNKSFLNTRSFDHTLKGINLRLLRNTKSINWIVVFANFSHCPLFADPAALFFATSKVTITSVA
jgi:hypothetical protein